jgi:SAM-dependent methyltransferase
MMHKKDKRDDFLRMVPLEAQRIFDVGCAAGNLAAKLKAVGKEVVGVDCVPELVASAKKIADRVYLADVEAFEIPEEERPFDAILYADVLEHLRDPLSLLKKHRPHLAPGGSVVASIPNVQYYKLLGAAAMGCWDYADGGMLDKTHVRFFGWINIEELFVGAGYKIICRKRNVVASKFLRLLNGLLLGCLDNFLTYQYYICAVRDQARDELSIKIRGTKKI